MKKLIAMICAFSILFAVYPTNVNAADTPAIRGYGYSIYEGDNAWSFIKRISKSGTSVYIGSKNGQLPLYSDRQMKKKSIYVKKGKTIQVVLKECYGYGKTEAYCARVVFNNKTYYIPSNYIIRDVNFKIYDYQLIKDIPFYSIIREKKGMLSVDWSDISSYKNAYPILGILGSNIIVFNARNNEIVSVDRSDFYTKPISDDTRFSLYDDCTVDYGDYKILCINNYSNSSNVDAQVKRESMKTIRNNYTRYQFMTRYYPEEGMYKIYNVKSGKFLEVRDGKKGKSSSVRQYNDRSFDDDCQMFQIIKADGSYIYLRSKLGTFMYFGYGQSSSYVGVLNCYNVNSDNQIKWHVVKWK